VPFVMTDDVLRDFILSTLEDLDDGDGLRREGRRQRP
jgi:hypothetical protein